MSKKRRGTMLNRKLLRDMGSGWKSFASVLVICILAVTLYCGISSSAAGMEKSLERQFVACNLADIWISGEIGDRQVRDISELPGVSDVQRRVTGRATVKNLFDSPELNMYMSDGDARVNRPMLFEGSDFPSGEKDLCFVNEAFAEAHGLKIGDRLSVEFMGMAFDLCILGIGYQAEYVVYRDGASLNADPMEFGYATVSPGTFGMFPYSGVSVTVESGADIYAVKDAIENLLDDGQKKVTLREDDVGLRMATEEVEQIRAIGQVFPAVFFFVAALITWSTMKRLVDNQRQQIGTLRAQGYSRAALMWHYTSYGLWIALAGAAVGLAFSRFFLGGIIVRILSSIYVMPGSAAYLEPGIAVFISILVIFIAAGASFLSCRRALREVPSALLRPKPPAKARRVFLERIRPLWRRFSFSNKMILRNMQRNRLRFFIGLVGIAGCTTLLLTGFGMRDSVEYVLENHYGYTMRYDVHVALDEPNLSDNYLNALRARAGAEGMESLMETGVEVLLDGGWQSKQLYVLNDEPESMRVEDANKNAVPMPTRGALITEKFREETGVEPGDTLLLRGRNGKTARVHVEGEITMQIGQGLYLSRNAFRYLDFMPYSPTSLHLLGGTIDRSALSDMDGVNTVRTITEQRENNDAMTKSLDLVVTLMVLFSGALALVVLYTLGQINFFERQRELATLMVLGFYPRENKRVILRENIIIAALGIPLGLLLGPYLHAWVLRAGLPNTLEFIPYISRISWVLTPVITLTFVQVVNHIIGGMFKKVDMVEALKSVE